MQQISNRLIKSRNIIAIVIMLCSSQMRLTDAANYYVDPVNGDKADDGSKEAPWKTLAEVFSENHSFEAGDTIFLLTGHHESVTVNGMNNGYVTVLPLEGNYPNLKKLTFSNAKKWKAYGLTISPETAPSYSRSTLITINSSASEIIVDSCYAFSVEDNTPWSASDWVSNACLGVLISGDNNTIRNNHFLNVDHGISIESGGENNLIKQNTIENFSGDGMRGIGSYNTFEYNTVKNCYNVDDNHDDGFQSWSRGTGGTVGTGTVYEIVLRGNTIINYTDPNQPFKGTLQGIGCFDGMFEDWVVENNVVITDHWHGITLMGARNCLVINNTVVDRNNTSPGPPWIRISKHKNGTLGTGNVIRNNLTTSMSNDAGIGTVEFNIIVSNYDDFFVDYANFDLRLKEGCPAIDAGTEEDAPFIDIEGAARPQGAGFDVGAYEYPSGPDTVPPVISSVISIKPREIEVLFNERMDDTSAQNIDNYSIDQDVVIVGAVLDENKKLVTLTVLQLAEEITYTLSVSNVMDITGNPVAENSTMTFEHICGYVTASISQEPNYPENTMDGNLSTRWSAEGVQWIKYDLCQVHNISAMEMAFYYGDIRASNFKIETSNDDEKWKEIFDGGSSGTSAGLESIDITESYGRYVKITGSGNSSNAWNSYTEVVIHAEALVIEEQELADLVDSANALHDDAIEGTGIGEYPPGSKAELKPAIDSAQAVLDNENATQAEINVAYVMLMDALEEFEQNKITGLTRLFMADIKVYPNPFDQQIHLELPDNIHIQRIYLIDVLGRVSAFPASTTKTTLEVGGLSPGIYILHLQTDKGVMNKRIMK
jgi:parallel beta-helix repeat protein